jgi:heavy metal sensor kinase
MKAPIRLRMTAWYVALLGVILALVATFVVVRMRHDLTRASDRDLLLASRQLATGYRTEGLLEFREVASSVLLGERPAAQVLDRSGHVSAAFGEHVAYVPMIGGRDLARALAGVRTLVTRHLGTGSAYRIVAVPVRRAGHTEAVVAGVSLAPIDRTTNRMEMLLLIALPAALLATAAGGWWLARRAMRPVERMTTAAELIGVGRLRKRIAPPGTRDELGHLADTLNSMLDRIQEAVDEQHRLVADASHELRTPLTVMRAEIDVSLRADDLSESARAVLASVREEVDRLSATVEDLLTLAAADEGSLAISAERVDLHTLASEVARSLRPLAEGRGLSIEVQGGPAVVTGEPGRLQHALRNLVENAIKFNRPGGEVMVRTWTSSDEAGVTVEDDGPGIPKELRERIFDRFFRIESSRSRQTGGGGLGLAIVREIAHAHGGEVRVLARQPRGSTFELSLPAVSPQAPAGSRVASPR